MSDYISSLTGQEMDIALQDMAMHNSEAYAIGERNGISVNEGDPTYHNNARYYAQIATSQVEPGNIGDAVRWDTDQTSLLSAVNKEQARANIAAGGTNPNLLDNSWLGSGEVVNQRNVTSGAITGNTYFIDRWMYSYGSVPGTYSVDGSGVTITSSTSTCYFMQKLPASINTFINGKTITASVMLADGTVYSTTITRVGGTQQEATLTYGLTVRFPSGSDRMTLLIAANYSFTFRACKLELGSVSTLANDVPTDYGTELLKCQRYFIRLNAPYTGNGFAVGRAVTDGTNCRVFFPLPVTLRTSPTISVSGLANLQLFGNGSAITPTAVSYSGRSENGVSLQFTASGLTGNTLYMLCRGSSDAYIDLSAEL